jgi:hypothetical protein
MASTKKLWTCLAVNARPGKTSLASDGELN